MGEIADMMLEGILDANGEYTGRNPGHPVYPKGWFGKKQKRNSWPQVCRVRCFLSNRGIPTGDAQKQMVKEYGEYAKTDRPTNFACSNWPDFKKWVDDKLGYVKPSKINSHA